MFTLELRGTMQIMCIRAPWTRALIYSTLALGVGEMAMFAGADALHPSFRALPWRFLVGVSSSLISNLEFSRRHFVHSLWLGLTYLAAVLWLFALGSVANSHPIVNLIAMLLWIPSFGLVYLVPSYLRARYLGATQPFVRAAVGLAAAIAAQVIIIPLYVIAIVVLDQAPLGPIHGSVYTNWFSWVQFSLCLTVALAAVSSRVVDQMQFNRSTRAPRDTTG